MARRSTASGCFFSGLEVLLVRHLASAPTTFKSSRALASPRWERDGGSAGAS